MYVKLILAICLSVYRRVILNPYRFSKAFRLNSRNANIMIKVSFGFIFVILFSTFILKSRGGTTQNRLAHNSTSSKDNFPTNHHEDHKESIPSEVDCFSL